MTCDECRENYFGKKGTKLSDRVCVFKKQIGEGGIKYTTKVISYDLHKSNITLKKLKFNQYLHYLLCFDITELSLNNIILNIICR